MSTKLDAAHSILLRTGVPQGWQETNVGIIARFAGGGTPDREHFAYWRNGTIPWITPTDLTANDSKFITGGAESISEEGLKNSNATLVPKGSIVFSTRGTVGNMAIAAVPLTCNQSCEILLPNDKKIDGEFLYYLLNFGLSAFVRLSGGTTFGSITRGDVSHVCFAVPTEEDEQAAIARILDAVDTALKCSRAAITRARELDHSLLHDLLETGLHPNRNGKQKRPAQWKPRRLDEVADVGSGVTLGKDVSGFKSVELPYLRVANVQDGHLDLSEIKTVRVRVEEVENYRLENGDVLMTEGGDLDKLGRGTIWEGQIPDCLHQNHIFRIRANRDLLDPAFFALVVESDIAKRYFNRVAKRTTNLASTNKTQVRAFQFPVPPTTDEQRDIAAIMKAAKAKLAGLIQKERALAELKKSLMHDLLTGKVRINRNLFKEEKRS
ncbi:MAG: restriction endonuclease subunit S [Betaproteobacteria bacterium]|nr:restriction endonuclease subunit S [Betaproteobacteria bacterium]